MPGGFSVPCLAVSPGTMEQVLGSGRGQFLLNGRLMIIHGCSICGQSPVAPLTHASKKLFDTLEQSQKPGTEFLSPIPTKRQL